MSRFLKFLFTAIIVISYTQVSSQTLLPANTIVTERFNTIGSSATAALPSNWRMSPSGNSVGAWSLGTTVTTQAASSGLPATGGRYNWATTSGTDRAIGFLTTGSYASPNAVMAYYKNTTGAAVTSFTISFMVKRFVVNTGDFSLSFGSSTDGTTWTDQTAGDIITGAFPGGTNTGSFVSPQTFYKTVTVNVPVANNADIYFRWIFNTGNSASQGLGLDNVAVFAGTATAALSAKLKDILQVDNGQPGQFNEGDVIRYQTTLKNTGTANATNMQIAVPPPPNTTIVPGSIKTSSVARDDSYSTAFNTLLNSGSVTSNDFGLPAPAVLSFGSTADATVTSPGSNGKSDNGGTVILQSNGTFTYTPPTNFSGVDKFSYVTGNGNLPNSTGEVRINVGSPAAATADAYNVIGNVSIIPTTVQGLLSNDAGGGLYIYSVNGNTANVNNAIITAGGSNLTVNRDGSFIYNPAKGFTGADNFTYTASNGFGYPTASTTVTISIAGMIWFIDKAAAAGGDGRLSAPFNSIAAFQSLNNGSAGNPKAGDNIFIYKNATAYTDPVTLLNNQKLIGQDAGATLSTITGLVPAAYSSPLPATGPVLPVTELTTTTAATNAINLSAGSSNTVRGLTIGNTTGAGINGNGFGTLTVSELTKNGTGAALNLLNGTLAAGFTSINSTNSTGSAITLTSIAGTLTIGATTISGAASQGIIVSSSTANMSFGNTTINTGGDGIALQNNTGGTRTFGNLTITTNSGTGFNASNGGTLITGSSNSISTSSGLCLNFVSSNAGAGGLTFTSLTTATGRIANISNSTGTKTLGRILQSDTNGSGALAAVVLDNAANVNIGGALASTIRTTTGAGLTIIGNSILNLTGAGLDVFSSSGNALDIQGAGIAAGSAMLRIN